MLVDDFAVHQEDLVLVSNLAMIFFPWIGLSLPSTYRGIGSTGMLNCMRPTCGLSNDVAPPSLLLLALDLLNLTLFLRHNRCFATPSRASHHLLPSVPTDTGENWTSNLTD